MRTLASSTASRRCRADRMTLVNFTRAFARPTTVANTSRLAPGRTRGVRGVRGVRGAAAGERNTTGATTRCVSTSCREMCDAFVARVPRLTLLFVVRRLRLLRALRWLR